MDELGKGKKTSFLSFISRAQSSVLNNLAPVASAMRFKHDLMVFFEWVFPDLAWSSGTVTVTSEELHFSEKFAYEPFHYFKPRHESFP